MLNFAEIFADEYGTVRLRNLTVDDLHRLTDEMIDLMLNITADATDDDVVFEPVDPRANDPYGKAEEANMPWTLGHVIVHVTASSEESAALATNLARGVPVEGRSRFEVPWETMRSAVQMRERLEESRRMRHAFLDAWPRKPNLDLTYTYIPRLGPLNAISRFVLGLSHDNAHLDQLRDIMQQARDARGAS